MQNLKENWADKTKSQDQQMIEKLGSFQGSLKSNYSLTNFNPTIEAINVTTKKTRQKVAGSLKKKIK